MYKEGLALNKQQCFIYHKNQPNQTKSNLIRKLPIQHTSTERL